MTTIQDIDKSLDEFLGTIRAWDEKSSDLRDAAIDALADDVRNHYDLPIASINSMLAKIDNGMKELQVIRAKFASRRSARAKINELPEDILRLIFGHCGRTEVRTDNGSLFSGFAGTASPGPRLHPAFPVSWTCSYWRKISLDHSGMWAHVNLASFSQRMVEELFKRAKEHPLVIHCHIPSHGQSERAFDLASELLPLKMSRVKELSLDIRISGKQLAATPLTCPAPLIEQLHFGLSTQTLHNVLPYALFKGEAPKLRHLTLDGIRMPWNIGFYRNLSTLIIRNFDRHATSLRDSDICCVIQDSPRLEILEIRSGSSITQQTQQTQPSDPSTMVSRTSCPRVELKHLSTLTLVIPVQIVHHLLSSIAANHITSLTISLEGGVMDSNAHLVAPLFHPDILPRSALSGMKQLIVHAHGSLPIGTYLWATETLQTGFMPSLNQRHCRVEWRDSSSQPVYIATLRQVASNVLAHRKIEHIERLVLSSDCDADDHPCAIYTHLPSLSSVAIDRAVVPSAIGQLCSSNAGTPATGERSTITELTIRHCAVTSEQLDALIVWCSRRREPLRKLVFTAVAFKIASRSAIEAIVRGFDNIAQLDVVWGWGCEFYCSDDSQTYQLQRKPLSRKRYEVVHSPDLT
ncbi:uncharacterized protein PHACADRAFT_149010 [Phanerochaete carnosa HHB-10118-sp]|uniref:F-box domain-containing protein n=1 Tax=Phanerochaete carnosa (strain HHB-10118-sp) TaxID=650164 RepID=K5VLV5_PHACS|nr:uncharacterized protein PHACADRAFT_149010 [Phanerochaete carnosa HHB-10118-sp]EKM52398.1 hypothetical protein PHACADRAFT_149010 [Phanerochaete carnosa HHB-10118-sp]